jgi:hypothetical protein
LPQGSALIDVLGKEEGAVMSKDDVFGSIEKDLKERIWERNEDPDLLRSYLIGDEVSESVAGSGIDVGGKAWWRTRLVIRSLLAVAVKDQSHWKAAVRRTQGNQSDSMDESDATNEEVLGVTTDGLVRYKTVLLAAIGKDAEAHSDKENETVLLISGESHLLQQAYLLLLDSRTMLESCIECLLLNGLVSNKGILHFLLSGESQSMVPRWWTIASSSIRVGLEKLVSDSDAIGMVVDAGSDAPDETAASRRVGDVISFIKPLLSSAVDRVCELLKSGARHEPSRKLTPREVDLVEGLKLFMLGSKAAVLAVLKTGGDGVSLTERNARAVWEENGLSGTNLAANCRGMMTCTAVESLVAVLEAF